MYSNKKESEIDQNTNNTYINIEESNNLKKDNTGITNKKLNVLLCTANIYMWKKESPTKILKILKDRLFIPNKENFDVIIFGFQEIVPYKDQLFDFFLKSELPEFEYSIAHTGQGPMKNAIAVYAKDNTKINKSSLKLSTFHTSRSAAIIDLYKGKLKIAITHLCGGRYDDKKWNQFTNARDIQINEIINKGVNVIAGDFNASDLNKLQKIVNKYWGKYMNGKSPDNLFDFQKQPHISLKSKGFLPLINTDIIKQTTIRSKRVIDWIYVNQNLKPILEKSYIIDALVEKLSDHNFVVAEFSIQLGSE